MSSSNRLFPYSSNPSTSPVPTPADSVAKQKQLRSEALLEEMMYDQSVSNATIAKIIKREVERRGGWAKIKASRKPTQFETILCCVLLVLGIFSAIGVVIALYQLDYLIAAYVGGAYLLVLGAILLRYSKLNLSACEQLLFPALIVVILAVVLAIILTR